MKEKKKVTLIPYGFLIMVGLYFLSDLVEKESMIFKIMSVLAFISLVVMVIHAIRIAIYFFKCVKEKQKEISYKNWKREYINSNPADNKTEEELKIIFEEELQAEEERKRKEFERIMASNPEVDKSKKAKEKPKSEYQQMMEAYTKAKIEASLRKADDNKIVRCPKCGSTSITANKKGLSLAKGAAGVFVAGAIGVVAAGHGKNKVIITCLNCGHQWKAGKK